MNPIPDIFNNGQPPQELYFMTSIANVPSILQRGILSHKRVQEIQHNDISNIEVQERRAHKIVRNPARQKANKKALTIHQYANLYLRAHNSMMSVKVTEIAGKNAKGYDEYQPKRDASGEFVRDTLCVLRIDPRILTRKEVVVSTRNAARGDANFDNAENLRFSSESVAMQLEPLSKVFREDKDKAEKRKAVRQAEVLIPYELHPSYIRGIYVANDVAKKKLTTLFNPTVPVPIDFHPTLFYDPVTVKDWKNGGFNPLAKINAKPLANLNYPELITKSPESSDDEASIAQKNMNSFEIEQEISDDETPNVLPVSAKQRTIIIKTDEELSDDDYKNALPVINTKMHSKVENSAERLGGHSTSARQSDAERLVSVSQGKKRSREVPQLNEQSSKGSEDETTESKTSEVVQTPSTIRPTKRPNTARISKLTPKLKLETESESSQNAKSSLKIVTSMQVDSGTADDEDEWHE